jgi:hypothetical protein
MRLALKKRFFRLKRPGLDTMTPSCSVAVPELNHLVPAAIKNSFKKPNFFMICTGTGSVTI